MVIGNWIRKKFNLEDKMTPLLNPYIKGFHDKSKGSNLEFKGDLNGFRKYMAGVEAAHVDANQCMGCGKESAVWKHKVTDTNYCRECIGSALLLRAIEGDRVSKLTNS